MGHPQHILSPQQRTPWTHTGSPQPEGRSSPGLETPPRGGTANHRPMDPRAGNPSNGASSPCPPAMSGPRTVLRGAEQPSELHERGIRTTDPLPQPPPPLHTPRRSQCALGAAILVST